MFLRSTEREKDGKAHRYFSVVENRRLPGSRTVQRKVWYLGEINDMQQAAWRKTLEVFDEDAQDYRTTSLFPDDREVPADALDSIQVKLSGLELRRPRTFGACWLGCELWHRLGLDEFWRQRLPEAREAVSWAKVLQLEVVNCLLDPGSDFRLHRQWYVDTAMDELLETDFAVAAKDRLYRCLDRVLPHKDVLVSGGQGQTESHRTTRWPLSAAQQPHRRRSGGVVDALRATDSDRKCVPRVEKRTEHPAHRSSIGTSGRCARTDCVPGVQSASHLEEPPDDARTEIDAGRGLRETGKA